MKTGNLVQHRLAFLFECRGVSEQSLRTLCELSFSDLATRQSDLNWLNPIWFDESRRRFLSDKRPWQWSPIPVSADLHASAQRILQAMPSESGSRAGWLKLNNLGQALIGGAFRGEQSYSGKMRATYSLTLPSSAIARLKSPALQSTVTIEDVALMPFGTKTGIAVLFLQVSHPIAEISPLQHLVEATHLLADERRPTLHWVGSPQSGGFRLRDIVKGVLSGSGIEVPARSRAFSYSAVLVDELGIEESRDLALRLSRHFHSGYTPEALASDNEFF